MSCRVFVTEIFKRCPRKCFLSDFLCYRFSLCFILFGNSCLLFLEFEGNYFSNSFFCLFNILIILLLLFFFGCICISGNCWYLNNNMTLSTILRAGNSWLSGSETIDAFFDDFLETIRYFIFIEFWILFELFFHIYTIVELYSTIKIEPKLVFTMRNAFGKCDTKV